MIGTIRALLEALKNFVVETTEGFNLPTAIQKGDTAQLFRAPEIHLMRLPEAASYTKYAPYVIIQFVNGKDEQPAGRYTNASANVRLVFCTYDKNAEDGAMSLLNMIEAVRIALLRKVTINEQFKLDKETGLETLIYPSDVIDTGPYYGGEMSATFFLPPIERDREGF